MINRVYTVFDSKVESYMLPFFMQAKGAAIRAFSDLVNNPEHAFCKHKEDYTLFEIGTYDDSSAKLESYFAPISLGCAVEFYKQ